MQVIRDNDGKVTKVIITEKEYDETSKDYKGEHDGKRSWMPPFDVFGTTCSLTEGSMLEIISEGRRKKFWCHYIASDGNTPRRKSMELINLGDLIPAIGENAQAETPLWYEHNDKDSEWYIVYAQLSDTVAVRIPRSGLYYEDVRTLQKTPSMIDKDWDEWLKKQLDTFPTATEKYKNELFDERMRYAKEEKAKRERGIAILQSYMDYTGFLLTQATWITNCELRAYEEIESPYLPVLQVLRKKHEAEREEEDRKREEEYRKQEEEERRKEAEAEAKEQQRLTEEAKKFKSGKKIKGEDVVELCRRYGIKVHLRTIHNLQQVVYMIDTQSAMLYSGCKAKLTGSFKACEDLYDYLQNHTIE